MVYLLLVTTMVTVTMFSLLISLPIYIAVLVAVFVNRNVAPFNSEFYRIFVGLGIIDIICYVLYLFKKMVFLGHAPAFLLPYNVGTEACALFYFPFWVCGFLQYELTLLLTLNRFVSVVKPTIYNRYWTRTFTTTAMCSLFVFCFLLSTPIFFADCRINEYVFNLDGMNETLHSGPLIATQSIDSYFKRVWTFHVLTVLTVCCFSYGVMIIQLHQIRLMENKRRRTMEYQMLAVGLFVVFINSVFAGYFCFRDIILHRITINDHLQEWIVYYISDVYDLPNGIMIFLTSKHIRYHILRRAIPTFAIVTKSRRSNNGPNTTHLSLQLEGRSAIS